MAAEDKIAEKPVKSVLKKETPAKAKEAEKKGKKEAAKPKKKQEKVEEEEEEALENADAAFGSDEESELDEQTKALMDTLDDGEESDEDESKQVSTFKKGQDVGKIPTPKKAPQKQTNGDSKPAGDSQPGVMYIARLPHGFYEHELRGYFSQFGEITRLRVVRNKKTGASRHRAFIEFADAEVADIAARTMDKYLLFGHILTCKIVPPAQVHPDLFKGANRRFKVVPWNKMAGRQLERPLSESQWQVKIAKEEQRRAARAEKLKEMGYEFEAPALKVPKAKPVLENGEEEKKAIETAPAPAVEEKESKEVAKRQAEEEVEEKAPAPKTKKVKEDKPAKEAATISAPKKGKKSKKTKS